MERDGHIYHGYLANVLEPWVQFEGSEWGEQMRAIHSAYSMGEDYAGLENEELDTLKTMLLKHIRWAYEGSPGEIQGFFEEYYPEETLQAKKYFAETREYWMKRANEMAKYNDGAALVAFGEADIIIPKWMKTYDPKEELTTQVQA